MKQKKYFILAAAAALFAACSSDDTTIEQAQKQQAQQVPVAFDSYVNRGTTRAGLVDELTTTTIQTSGFGVFAYYTNADNYDPTFTPNFMYNQLVTYSSSTWGYAPVKYWPNEFGNGSQSEDVDKVSFFAYAPYVSVNPASGKVNGDGTNYEKDNGDITMGIVGMTRNNSTSDPMVKYIASFYPDEQVDLTWGTVPTGQEWNLKNTAAELDPALDAGLPWLNIQHPKETSTSWNDAAKVKFNFQHSLAALNVTVDTKVNSTSEVSPDAKTKVFIRSVTFEGFDTKGALNLNNAEANKALWYNFNCEDELNNGSETTIKDGRKDGKEGVTAATSEYAAINPKFVQSDVFAASEKGVNASAANLFRLKTGTGDPASYIPASNAPIYVIPNDDPLKVTIEYDVLTEDANLAGKLNDGQTPGSVVKNVITRYITKGNAAQGSVTEPSAENVIKLANGKTYTIKLHLGLNSVEFDAEVADWGTGANGGADLPHNN